MVGPFFLYVRPCVHLSLLMRVATRTLGGARDGHADEVVLASRRDSRLCWDLHVFTRAAEARTSIHAIRVGSTAQIVAASAPRVRQAESQTASASGSADAVAPSSSARIEAFQAINAAAAQATTD